MSEQSLENIFVNGRFVPAHSRTAIQIQNPATLELIKRVPECDVRDVNAAVAAAKAAQREWDKTPGVEKAVLLHEVARRIRAREEALAELMCCESGKPIWEALDCIEWVAAC